MGEVEPITKQRIGPILWRGKWIIIASIVVMVALALAYTSSQSKVYQASGILAVAVPTTTPGGSDITATNEALAQNYSALLVSPGFLKQVRPQVDNGKLSVSKLQSRLTATAPAQSALVKLQATGSSTGQAERIAQQVITGFLANLQNNASSRTFQLQSQLQQSISSLNSQIGALNANPNPTTTTTEQIASLRAARDALVSQNAGLVANGEAQGTSATEGAPPVASSTPISPKRSLNLIAGLLLGAVLGVGLAWLRELLRPAIHSAEDVTALADLPLLASIPLKSRLKPNDPSVAEAYGILQANLTFALRGDDMSVVTLVGFNPGVGKTSAIEGIARAGGRGERQLLIVDGDMRAATLSTRMGYSEQPGLSDVLQGRVTADDALVPVEEGLTLLPTMPARVNIASLLSGSRTFALMAELRERFDLVLIDSPPLSGLADGLILASQSDAVALVVRAGLTKPADVLSAMKSLRQNMTPIVGAVVFEELPVEAYYGAVATDSRVKASDGAPAPAIAP